MPILVDTGAVELLRRRERRAETLVLRYFPPVVCTHVVGEFLFGQTHGKVSATAFQEAREFIGAFEVLCPDATTASIYARIREQLSARGIRIPDPDYWIAAHALEHRWPLLSTDQDFRQIPELTLHLLASQ